MITSAKAEVAFSSVIIEKTILDNPPVLQSIADQVGKKRNEIQKEKSTLENQMAGTEKQLALEKRRHDIQKILQSPDIRSPDGKGNSLFKEYSSIRHYPE